jgi:hypothetical protein
LPPIPERNKGREKTLPAAQVETSIALDFTTPIREALTFNQLARCILLIDNGAIIECNTQ